MPSLLNLKYSFRSLKQNKFTLFINIFGFSVSLAFVIMIGLYVQKEYSVDDFHKDKERVFYDGDTERQAGYISGRSDGRLVARLPSDRKRGKGAYHSRCHIYSRQGEVEHADYDCGQIVFRYSLVRFRRGQIFRGVKRCGGKRKIRPHLFRRRIGYRQDNIS